MLDKDTIIKVTNRDSGSVGYSIPDLGNLHREFATGETKEITMDELRKLSYLPGGRVLLERYLVMDNKEAVEELLTEVEPEYYYTEDDVKFLLLDGTLDQLKDCLDFAPEGTINLVKKVATELKLNDIAKRKAILEATGFNVTTAIEINEDTEEEDAQSSKTRRAATPSHDDKPTNPGRRTSNYKIIK